MSAAADLSIAVTGRSANIGTSRVRASRAAVQVARDWTKEPVRLHHSEYQIVAARGERVIARAVRTGFDDKACWHIPLRRRVREGARRCVCGQPECQWRPALERHWASYATADEAEIALMRMALWGGVR